MVAYDAEGLPSAPVTQDVPLTPAAKPTINFCIEDVGHSPCVNTPVQGQAPFPVTAGDRLRFKLTGGSGGDDPIAYYAIAVGQPNTANVKNPVGKGSASDCALPSLVGSWATRLPGQSPPSSTVTTPTGGNPGASSGGTLIGPTAPKSGPSAHTASLRPSARARDSSTAPTAVPVFSDLEAGAFPAHDCQAYADRTVNASGVAPHAPTSGPNKTLAPHDAARLIAPGAGGGTTVLGATLPSQLYPTPTEANPVLITTPGHPLDFTFPTPGTYSVAIAAYTSAGLGAITRIDGFVAEPKRMGGRCETVGSEMLALHTPSKSPKGKPRKGTLAFSGNCITVVSQAGHPDFYVSPGTMDISGVPIAPQSGDSIVIDANNNLLYVTRCAVPEGDLNATSYHDPCPEPADGQAGRLYLALGGGKDGQPGISEIKNVTNTRAQAALTPLSHGLGQVTGSPAQGSQPVTGCGLYPGSQAWGHLASGAKYDGFPVATVPCVAFAGDGHSRVAYWDSLPQGFGNGASQKAPTSQVLLYGSDVPAVSDLHTNPYANVARKRHPKAVIAGSFPKVKARVADIPGFPAVPSCPPSTTAPPSGLSIPDDTDMGPIQLPAGAQFCYVSATGDFIGRVDVNIPAPLPLDKVEVGFEVGHGRLIDAGGEVSGDPGIPIGPLLVSDLKFDIQTDPVLVAGAITASIVDLLQVNAGLIVNSAKTPTTPSVDLEGTASIIGITFGNFAIDYGPQGFGMHVTIAKDFGPASINITVKGALGFSPPAFYMEGDGSACLFICLGVKGLVSNEGLAACGSIDLAVVTLSAGFAVMWSGPNSGVHLFTGCDLEPFIPPSLRNIAGTASVARAGPAGRLALSRGQPQLILKPGTGSEQLKLRTPGSNMCGPKVSRGQAHQFGCTPSTVAVQVHSPVVDEAPGATPLVTLTGPSGDPRSYTTESTPGYYGFDGSARMSGGLQTTSQIVGQTDEGMALVDQNPVPVTDSVRYSRAYCPAHPGTKLLTLAASCPKVTTTTFYVADPGPGKWTLHVSPLSAPVVDTAIATQEPTLTARQFHPTVQRVSLTGSAHSFELSVAGRHYSSALLRQPHRLLLSPSVEITPSTPDRYARLAAHPIAADLDVPAIDQPRLRAVVLKVPASFAGSVKLIDQGTAAGQGTVSQLLASGITAPDIPAGGLPIVFAPMARVAAHQQIEAFLSNSAGMPSRMMTLSSFTTPPLPTPRPPEILRTVRDRATVHVYFDPGNAPVADGIGLALAADNGQQFQEQFGPSQLHAVGRLGGIGAARQAREYEVTIPSVDPTVPIHVAIDAANAGNLSPTSRLSSVRPAISSISESRFLLTR
jgi:hypothetical protein